jgi:hypothetical protein
VHWVDAYIKRRNKQTKKVSRIGIKRGEGKKSTRKEKRKQ